MAWTDPDFAVGRTAYHVERLGAFPAWRVMETIRRQLGRQFDVAELKRTLDDALSEDGDGTTQAFGMATGLVITDIVLKLDEVFVEDLRKKMFDRVWFSVDGAPDRQKLLGLEDMAFQEPTDVYVVLTRALAVHFLDSLSDLFANSLKGLAAGPQ